MTIKWQQRCYPRVEQRSWHWYAHEVTPLEGNEALPSPLRGTYEPDRQFASRVLGRRDDMDPTRGHIDRSEHRRNAAIGSSWRAKQIIAKRRAS